MTNEVLEDLHSKILLNEARSRRRILLFSLTPVVAGVIWLAFVWTQVDKLKQQSRGYEVIINEDKAKIAALEVKLNTITVFMGDVVDLDWHDVKSAMMSSSQGGQLLERMLELKNRYDPKFNVNGHSPEEGFNSPAMMRYLLAQMGVMQPGNYATSTSAIEDQLGPYKVEVNEPDGLKSGDIVIYSTGYAMLFVHSRDPYDPTKRKKYSVGMTPFGIQALKPEFNKIETVYRIFH